MLLAFILTLTSCERDFQKEREKKINVERDEYLSQRIENQKRKIREKNPCFACLKISGGCLCPEDNGDDVSLIILDKNKEIINIIQHKAKDDEHFLTDLYKKCQEESIIGKKHSIYCK